jgi:uncharacterized paraquat-inducible protein A
MRFKTEIIAAGRNALAIVSVIFLTWILIAKNSTEIGDFIGLIASKGMNSVGEVLYFLQPAAPVICALCIAVMLWITIVSASLAMDEKLTKAFSRLTRRIYYFAMLVSVFALTGYMAYAQPGINWLTISLSIGLVITVLTAVSINDFYSQQKRKPDQDD